MANSEFTFYVDEHALKAINRMFIGYSYIEKEYAITKALSDGMSRMVSLGKIALRQTILHPAKSRGNLIKSMTNSYVVKNGLAKGTAGFKRSSRFKKVGGGNHSYLVDRGTKERWQRSTGKYTGSVRRNSPQTGSQFWTKTVYNEGPKVVDNLMEAINKALDVIISRNIS